MPGRVVNVESDYSTSGIEVHIHSVGNLTGGSTRSRVKFYIQTVGLRVIVDFYGLSFQRPPSLASALEGADPEDYIPVGEERSNVFCAVQYVNLCLLL